MLNIEKINPNQAAELVLAMAAINEPVMLWGAPAVGKSDAVRQAGKAMGVKVIDVRLSQLDPVDLRGLPHIDGAGRMAFATPVFLPVVERDGERGILFLDEITSADPSVMAAGYQLILDRALGEYQLPDGWAIVAAGNRTTDRAIARQMPTALISRFGTHVEVVADALGFAAWADGKGLSPYVSNLLRARPELISTFDPANGQQPYASPRTWEKAAKIIAANMPQSIRTMALIGAVGKAAAIELESFIRTAADMPNLAAILAGDPNVPAPNDDKPHVIYATVTALSVHATPANWPHVYRYLQKLPQEFAAVAVTQIGDRLPEIKHSSEYTDWAIKTGQVFTAAA